MWDWGQQQSHPDPSSSQLAAENTRDIPQPCACHSRSSREPRREPRGPKTVGLWICWSLTAPDAAMRREPGHPSSAHSPGGSPNKVTHPTAPHLILKENCTGTPQHHPQSRSPQRPSDTCSYQGPPHTTTWDMEQHSHNLLCSVSTHEWSSGLWSIHFEIYWCRNVLITVQSEAFWAFMRRNILFHLSAEHCRAKANNQQDPI